MREEGPNTFIGTDSCYNINLKTMLVYVCVCVEEGASKRGVNPSGALLSFLVVKKKRNSDSQLAIKLA